ncbi:hypothetical protein AN958_09048, partial [Leucoagaricus sp. SymC.cos]
PKELLFDRKDIKAGDPINIIIFGETGTGKSSIINMISGEEQPVAPTSNGPIGCTFKSDPHTVTPGEVTYTLWDTAGLNEGEAGSVPANTALLHLQALIGKLSTYGISLLIYCVRGSRYRDVLKHNYEIFWRIICQESIPIVIVVTGLENEDSELREGWWTANKEELIRHGMDFRGHACITATKGKKGIFQKEYEESKRQVQGLIETNCPSDYTWVVNSPEKWRRKVRDDIRDYLRHNGYMERDLVAKPRTRPSEIPGSFRAGPDPEDEQLIDGPSFCNIITVAGRVVVSCVATGIRYVLESGGDTRPEQRG